MNIRQFAEKDFGKTDGWCNYEGGEGLIYPPEYWESNESFRKRLQQYPQGSLACVNDNDEVIGYMFCHPWDDTIVPLNHTEFKIPEHQTCFYIHDIAVISQWRRKGIATKFITIAKELAKKHNFNKIKGISVLGSWQIWERFGFKSTAKIPYGKGHIGIMIELEI